MNKHQTARMLNQLLRMFRQGGTTRWLAIAIVVGCAGLLLFRPDLVSPDGSARNGQSIPAGRIDANSGSSAELVDRQPSVESSGQLTEVANRVYRSAGGLEYARGSQHGHRLKHVLAHGEDQPNRPGQHGVFSDPNQDSIVGLLDEAYLKWKNNASGVRSKREDRRVILTVDMGRNIGYVGGQSGHRRGYPKAQHLRLVLEGQRVITAYPLVP